MESYATIDKTINNDFFTYCNSKSKSILPKRSKARFPWLVIIPIIIAAVSLGVAVASLVISADTYNKRYDATAESAGALEFTFAANGKNSGEGTFTATAGTLTYGYFQKSGDTPSEYSLRYKRVGGGGFNDLRKSLTVYRNNNYTGDFYFATNNCSEKYEIKCERKNNTDRELVFEFDWGHN